MFERAGTESSTKIVWLKNRPIMQRYFVNCIEWTVVNSSACYSPVLPREDSNSKRAQEKMMQF